MLDAFDSYVKSQRLFEAKDRLLVACSGGIDSMVLMDLLLKGSFDFEVAHVNFQLRGKESHADEAFVAAACHQRDICFHVKKLDAAGYSKSAGVSVQMAARELRYDWFEELMRQRSSRYLLTAHHADDSMETVIFNLAKGTGIPGLVGIESKSGYIRRPLLFAEKKDIEAFASAEGINWREDASNSDTKYLRNKIRHLIMPVLREINPSMVGHFQDTQRRLVGTRELLKAAIDQCKRDHLQRTPEGMSLSLEWIAAEERCLVVLAGVLSDFSFSFRQSEQIFEALQHHPGKVFSSATHQIYLDRAQLLIEKLGAEVGISMPVDIYPNAQEVGIEGLRLTLIHNQSPSDDWMSSDAWSAALDEDTLTFPLNLRRWQPGDAFQPLGMQGRKKVSDYLIDVKVPLPKKREVYVLLSGENIVWVVGYRLDDRYKITASTQRMMKIIAER